MPHDDARDDAPVVPIDPDLAPSDTGEPSVGRAPIPRDGGGRTNRVQPRVLIAIAAGGALGAPARYEVAQIIHVAKDTFPWATFWTNVSGSFALGLLLILLIERFPPSQYLRPFFATGFLGVFTTFSTFAVETDLLIKDGHTGLGVVYAAASLAAGFGAVWAGITLGRLVPAREVPAMTVPIAIGLVVAGAIGAPARDLLDGFVQDRTAGAFPWGTFVINVSGSFLLGLITGAALYHGFPGTPKIWLGTGFCGSYTTFSTFTFETIRLLEERAAAAAIRNAVMSLLVGAAAAGIGLAIAAVH